MLLKGQLHVCEYNDNNQIQWKTKMIEANIKTEKCWSNLKAFIYIILQFFLKLKLEIFIQHKYNFIWRTNLNISGYSVLNKSNTCICTPVHYIKFVGVNNVISKHTHTHTHTQRERERERESLS